MKIRNAMLSLCTRSLYESFSTDLMTRLARMVDVDYDIYRQTGFPVNIPIPPQSAAERIVRDMAETGQMLAFVETLVVAETRGIMGRTYRVARLREIVKALADEGFRYDPATGLFVESDSENPSPNWGRLQEGDEKTMAILRIDVVGNSEIVRTNPGATVDKAFRDFHALVERAVTKRSGRVWSWEGDGCVCAFIFGAKERAALFASMDILHEIYFYNRLENPLSRPFSLRMAVHSGPVKYSRDPGTVRKNETVREAMDIEARLAVPDSVSVSLNVFINTDRWIQELFGPEATAGGFRIRRYEIRAEA